MEQKYILALEIGSSKVKGAVGLVDDYGVLSVEAIEEERILDSVRHGIIINVETVANRVNSIIRKLENRVSPHKALSCYLGIGGRSFRSAPRTVERLLPVEDEITAELIAQMRQEALATALSDREVVDVTDGEYWVDGHKRNNPIGTFGRNIRATFNLITCRLTAKRNLKRVISERLNLKINGYFVRQLAEADLVLSNDERLQGCMLVDLGAETTTVSIYKHGVLIYMATIPLGSRNITRDIVNGLNQIESRAEELKIAGGNAMPQNQGTRNSFDGIDYTDINNFVHARASEIVANINEQINFANLSSSDLPGGIILIGGGAKLMGLSTLMEKITKLKVRVGIPSPAVRLVDVRIAHDSIDAIATLYAASRLPNLVNCMSMPEPVKPKPEPEAVVAPVVEEKVEAEVKVTEPAAEEKVEEKPAEKPRILDDTPDSDFYDDTPRRRRKSGISIFRTLTDKITELLSENDSDDDDDR